jgi:hypothetical protein
VLNFIIDQTAFAVGEHVIVLVLPLAGAENLGALEDRVTNRSSPDCRLESAPVLI